MPMPTGFMYLTAVIDWFSRYVLAWGLSNTLDGGFCVEALELACTKVRRGNLSKGVAISMDGRGRALDNVFIERLWWSVKYESIYLHEFATVRSLEQGLSKYFRFFCQGGCRTKCVGQPDSRPRSPTRAEEYALEKLNNK